ncbi:MAG: hypothetical protein WA139_03175 [Candidatus Aenigmatarchaeota archaeon]
MSYMFEVLEKIRMQIYPTGTNASKTVYNKGKPEEKPFASIEGRTRKEIVDDAIEAIKKYGLIEIGVGAMVKNISAGD